MERIELLASDLVNLQDRNYWTTISLYVARESHKQIERNVEATIHGSCGDSNGGDSQGILLS